MVVDEGMVRQSRMSQCVVCGVWKQSETKSRLSHKDNSRFGEIECSIFLGTKGSMWTMGSRCVTVTIRV